MALSNGSCGKINCAWWLLKVTYGLLFIAAGVDKFFNVITVWSKYISPMVFVYVPVEQNMLITAVGICEIVIGLAILTKLTRLGAYLAALWLLVIAANLLSMGLGIFVDVAVRDIVMAMGALALAKLTKARCLLVGEGMRQN